MKIKLMCCK